MMYIYFRAFNYDEASKLAYLLTKLSYAHTMLCKLYASDKIKEFMKVLFKILLFNNTH